MEYTEKQKRQIKKLLGLKVDMKNEWCTCKEAGDDWQFFDDGMCPCGCNRHHYHCKKCGGITQTG
jgi:hypothetical protein